MWSPLYWYYNIRGDADYLREVPSVEIDKILENTGVLVRTGKQMFSNTDQFPWIEIIYAKSNQGNFSVTPSYTSQFSNLIAVVASRREPENERKYLAFLLQIAERLDWELVLEQDDEENEDIIIKAVK
jgi:hypothetical protein